MRKASRALPLILLLLSSPTLAAAPNPPPVAVQAPDEAPTPTDHAYANALLGASIPTGSANAGASTRFGFGLAAGWLAFPGFGLGAYYMRNSGSIANSSLTLSTTFYGLEANYFFDDGINFGARGGLTSLTTSVSNLSVTSTPFSAGPRLGFEQRIPVTSLALGAEYNPMFVFSQSTNNTNGVASTTSAFVVHNIYVDLRYYFY